jgi:caveolin 1
MTDSKNGSKSNLNESNMPLLDDVEKSGETPEKEQIEMKEDEKKDDSTEKKDKKKKEKKPKEKKEKGPNCIDLISKDLDLANRDCNMVNVDIDLDFDDVLAEPAAAQGFEWVWKVAFVVFSQTKGWFYKLFAALVAIPASLMWAVVFAAVSVLYIWVLSPALRLFDLTLAIVRRVVVGAMSVTVEPASNAVSNVFAKLGQAPPARIAQEA